jgi:phosphoglycerol transferase
MGNSCRNGLIVAFTAFSAFSLSGCGDEPEPNQAPSAPAPATQAEAPPAIAPAPAPQPGVAAPQAAAPQAAPQAAPIVSYQATLAEGIDFRKPGYPDFISEVTGVSIQEGWGRWTNGNTATFKFKDPLPKKFTLLVEAGAFGDNLNKPIKFRVGSVEKECIFKGKTNQESYRVATLHFNSSDPGNTLVITIPAPTKSPTDDRMLGIGLTAMKIDTSGKL